MSEPAKTMYVRYIGTKVCFTINDPTPGRAARFYMANREECSAEELALCDTGGGDMPLTETIELLADAGEPSP